MEWKTMEMCFSLRRVHVWVWFWEKCTSGSWHQRQNRPPRHSYSDRRRSQHLWWYRGASLYIMGGLYMRESTIDTEGHVDISERRVQPSRQLLFPWSQWRFLPGFILHMLRVDAYKYLTPTKLDLLLSSVPKWFKSVIKRKCDVTQQ